MKPTVPILRKTILVSSTLLVLALSALQGTYADQIVVPNSLANSEGNSNLLFTVDTRFQQVFAASQFSALSEPQAIMEIAFRPDGPFGRASAWTNPNLQMILATTSRLPDGLSATFESNLGPDHTVVYSGPISSSTLNTGPLSGPKAFNISIVLMTPFVYDPSAGNLLMDVKSTGPFFGPADLVADMEETSGDSVSLVAGGIDEVEGITSTLGLAARFTYGPIVIPEPTTMFLLATGLAGLALSGKRCRNKS
jgi:PEP-CTERM motif